MTRNSVTFVVYWRTRTERKRKKAEICCKDFGLSKIAKDLYAGNIRTREQLLFIDRLETCLPGKSDILHTFNMCKSCLENNAKTIQTNDHTYEIV